MKMEALVKNLEE
jgi:hypothetical protein